MRHKTLLLLLVLTLILPGAVFAQERGGNTRPAPSGSGGLTGSPGMSGAALNTGDRSGGQTGERPPMGGGQTGERPPMGGGQAGERPPMGGGQAGERPPMGGGQAGERPPMGGGQAGERPSGFAIDFSERGSGNFMLELPFMSGEQPGWMSRFGSGGFGTRSFGGDSAGEQPPILQNLGLQSEDLPAGMPEVPIALEDLSGLTEAQQNAQQAVDDAVTNSTAQAQQAADAATAQAQQAYDQLWTDYYTAVDYTAQTYYDTVTATTDYMLQSYTAAVDYTTQTVDYYLAYAEQYDYYCALYPWDCYSYSYDTVTNTYVYSGEASDAPAGTTTIGDVSITVGYPVTPSPTPSAEAYQALVLFANDQLGAVIEPLYAGVATDAVQQALAYLPDEIEAQILNTIPISGVTYWGLLAGGAGAVAVGDCATHPTNCTINSENLSVQLSSAAAGAYGILAAGASPQTAEEALALITTVYPKLNGLAFDQITDVEQGFAFNANTASIGYDVDTQQPVSTAKTIYAGVVQVNGAPFVYAVVGVGEGYVDIMQ